MEQNQQYNQEIIEILKKSRTSYATILKFKKSCKHLLNYIIEWCKSVNAPNDLPFPTMIYWTINSLHEQPKCSNVECDNRLPTNARCFPLIGFGYRCCSNSCAQRDLKHKEEQERKSLAKYGTKKPQQAKCSRDKMRATLASKPKSHWRRATKKRIATLQRSYGSEITNVSQLESHKKSVSETWDSKTRKEVESIVRSRKKTKLEKYGDENYCNGKKISETRKSFSDSKKLECHLLEKTFGMKLVSVEPPRIWCCNYGKCNQLMHLALNMKNNTDNDYLIPDAGMKAFTFM